MSSYPCLLPVHLSFTFTTDLGASPSASYSGRQLLSSLLHLSWVWHWCSHLPPAVEPTSVNTSATLSLGALSSNFSVTFEVYCFQSISRVLGSATELLAPPLSPMWPLSLCIMYLSSFLIKFTLQDAISPTFHPHILKWPYWLNVCIHFSLVIWF